MRRNRLRKQAREHLLRTIYQLQAEWKRMDRMVNESIEPSAESLQAERVARAKFIFLLREARYLNIHAIDDS